MGPSAGRVETRSPATPSAQDWVLPVTDRQAPPRAPPLLRLHNCNWRVGPWDRSTDWLLLVNWVCWRVHGF